MSTTTFCPAVIVQEWRTMSALLSAFGCIRRDAGARLSLSRGELVPLTPMSAAARRAGAFCLIRPTRKGFMWLLSFTHWLSDSPTRADCMVAGLTSPGGEMEGRHMVVFPLDQTYMASLSGAGIDADQEAA